MAINPVLYDKLPYDVQRDLAPVSLVVDNDELLVVNPANPAKDAAEFVANAKKSTQPVAIASTGIGSIPHLAMEQLADATKAPLLHVPYKGAAPAITDVMGGQVAAFFGDIPGLDRPRQGRASSRRSASPRPSAIRCSPTCRRWPSRGCPASTANNWYALFAPAKTPPAVVAALNEAVATRSPRPRSARSSIASGAVPSASSPQELGALLKRDTEKWDKLIKAKKITPDS